MESGILAFGRWRICHSRADFAARLAACKLAAHMKGHSICCAGKTRIHCATTASSHSCPSDATSTATTFPASSRRLLHTSRIASNALSKARRLRRRCAARMLTKMVTAAKATTVMNAQRVSPLQTGRGSSGGSSTAPPRPLAPTSTRPTYGGNWRCRQSLATIWRPAVGSSCTCASRLYTGPTMWCLAHRRTSDLCTQRGTPTLDNRLPALLLAA